MTDTDEQKITLATTAVSKAIKDQVKSELDDRIAVYSDFTNAQEFLEAIKSIEDPTTKAELYSRYFESFEGHQKVKDETLSKLIDSKIENEKKALNVELEKNQIRSNIFGDRRFLIFLMCFPIIISIFIVAISKSFVFASFVILAWYGMFLVFYFSQSETLDKLMQNFPRKND